MMFWSPVSISVSSAAEPISSLRISSTSTFCTRSIGDGQGQADARRSVWL